MYFELYLVKQYDQWIDHIDCHQQGLLHRQFLDEVFYEKKNKDLFQRENSFYFIYVIDGFRFLADKFSCCCDTGGPF
jgi:hypothetical protein